MKNHQTLEKLFTVISDIPDIGALAGQQTVIRFANGWATAPRIRYAEYMTSGKPPNTTEHVKLHLENGATIVVKRTHHETRASVQYETSLSRGRTSKETVNIHIGHARREISHIATKGVLNLNQ